jgi:AcrR family transcriptional regulator
MPNAAKRPYHHGDLRRVVIETAMEMLSAGDGPALTLREVARRAGVSHAAPYKHFPDKGALLSEIALIGYDRLRKAVTMPKRGKPGSFRDEFLAMGRAYVGFGTSNPALYRLMFKEDPHNDVEVHLNERALAAFNVLVELMQRGQSGGDFRDGDPRSFATAAWAQVHGITMLMIAGLLPTGKLAAETIDAAVSTLFEGLESGA